MSLYTIALFLHISGAICFFISIGVWFFGILALRRALLVEQVRVLTNLIAATDSIAVIGILILLAAGLYMAITSWGLQTRWIDVALVCFALIAPIGPGLLEPRMHQIAKIASELPEGLISETLRSNIYDPLLISGVQLLIIILFGFIFLMTNKPEFTQSIYVMLVAFFLGLISGLPYWFFSKISTQKA